MLNQIANCRIFDAGATVKFKRSLLVFCVVLLPVVAAQGQSLPKYEVAVGYSYMYFHTDLPQPPTHSLNGGGISFVYNATSWLGLEAQMNGYSFGQSWSDTLHRLGYVGPAGADMFTYQFGPQLKKHSGRWQPYISTLYGVAHSGGYASALRAKGSGTFILSGGGSNNTAFAMEIGGGIDIRLTKTVQLRAAELDYQLTRFGYQAYSSNQNNLKCFAGINFTFAPR